MDINKGKDKVVVYTSETGFSKKYAGWIAEALKCEAMDIKEWRRCRIQSVSNPDSFSFAL